MAMDVSPVKEDGKVYTVTGGNFEDSSFAMEALPNKNLIASSRAAEAGINITDCTNSGEERLAERRYHDVTESSSSFGDTDPGTSSGAVLGDVEVESRWRDDDSPLMSFDDFGDLIPMRKKKLTTHWKKFIRPLMWRCKWLELHIKEIQSQASKYDKELALCELRKQQNFQRFSSADLHVKSTPILCENQRVNIMKRKKRRRVEETVDVASYMAEHSLFSFYANKRPFADDSYMDDDCVPSATAAAANNARSKVDGANGDWVPLKFKDGDSFEDMLRKIGDAQAQVYQLRHRMRDVLCESAEKFASSDSLNLLAPHDLQTKSAAPAHSDFRCTDGEAKRGYHSETLFSTPEPKAPEQVMPESAVSSYGEVAPLPDMIEGIDQPLAEPSCGKIIEPNLVYNRRVKQESHHESGLRHVPMRKPQLHNDQQARSVDSLPEMKSESAEITVIADKQPTPKPRLKSTTPKGKKKRGKRKAGSSRWTRKSSA